MPQDGLGQFDGESQDSPLLWRRWRRSAMTNRSAVVRMLLVGVGLIFGGEAICVFGPDERVVHVGCHAALYAGIFLVIVGALLEATRRLRAMRWPPDEAGV